MKSLYALMAVVVLACTALSSARADHEYTNHNYYNRSYVVCSPPADLSKSAPIYEDMIVRRIQNEIRRPRVSVRFMQNRSAQFLTSPNVNFDPESIDISFEDNELSFSGIIDSEPCVIPMVVAISISGYNAEGDRVRQNVRTVIQIVGLKMLRTFR